MCMYVPTVFSLKGEGGGGGGGGGWEGGQHPPFYHVHAAQDSKSAMYVPRHKQLQGAQSPPPPLLLNPGGNTDFVVWVKGLSYNRFLKAKRFLYCTVLCRQVTEQQYIDLQPAVSEALRQANMFATTDNQPTPPPPPPSTETDEGLNN